MRWFAQGAMWALDGFYDPGQRDRGSEMDGLEGHRRAQEVFAAVLARVAPGQLGSPSPCTEWDAQGVVDHVIRGNQWVQALAGRDPVDLPGDPAADHAASAAGAHSVFAAEDGLERTFELPWGPTPGADFVRLRMGDVVTHAWDLASDTGQPTDLDADLAAEALAAVRLRVTPELRGPGMAFAEEQPCPQDRPMADQLAAFMGRAVG